MQFALLAIMAFWLGFVPRVQAQEVSAEAISRMLVTDLSPTRSMEMGQWFTDVAQSGRDTRGLGIIYVHVPGSAGTVSIHAAIYNMGRSGWLKNRDVTGLYGYSPRETLFFPDRIEIVTTTLGPNEPRCCPTVQTRWSFDLATGVAQEIK